MSRQKTTTKIRISSMIHRHILTAVLLLWSFIVYNYSTILLQTVVVTPTNDNNNVPANDYGKGQQVYHQRILTKDQQQQLNMRSSSNPNKSPMTTIAATTNTTTTTTVAAAAAAVATTTQGTLSTPTPKLSHDEIRKVFQCDKFDTSRLERRRRKQQKPTNRTVLMYMVSQNSTYQINRIEALAAALDDDNELIIVWDHERRKRSPFRSVPSLQHLHIIDDDNAPYIDPESAKLSRRCCSQEKALLYAICHMDEIQHVWFMEDDVLVQPPSQLNTLMRDIDSPADVLNQELPEQMRGDWFAAAEALDGMRALFSDTDGDVDGDNDGDGDEDEDNANSNNEDESVDATSTAANGGKLNQSNYTNSTGMVDGEEDEDEVNENAKYGKSLMNLFRLSPRFLQHVADAYVELGGRFAFFEAFYPWLTTDRNMTWDSWIPLMSNMYPNSTYSLKFRPCVVSFKRPGIYHPVKVDLELEPFMLLQTCQGRRTALKPFPFSNEKDVEDYFRNKGRHKRFRKLRGSQKQIRAEHQKMIKMVENGNGGPNKRRRPQNEFLYKNWKST